MKALVVASAAALYASMPSPALTQAQLQPIDAIKVFPNPQAITPAGKTYTDTIPDTLDLATWAQDYVRSRISILRPNSFVPTNPLLHKFSIPGSLGIDANTMETLNQGLCDSASFIAYPPCLQDASGQTGYGLVTLAQARAMSGYDVDNAAGTMTSQLKSLQNLLIADYAGSYYPTPGDGHASNLAWSLLTLEIMQEMFPSNTQIQGAMREYVRYHRSTIAQEPQDGKYYYFWYNDREEADRERGTQGGTYNSHFIQVAVQVLGAVPLLDWCALKGDDDACDLGMKVADYLRSYRDPIDGTTFWDNPNPAKFTEDAPVVYVGHSGSYCMAGVAFLADARARIVKNPGDPIAHEDVARAKAIYEFMKRRGGMGVLGSFGVASTVGLMLEMGMRLEELRTAFPDIDIPLGAYYEDAERWIRNTVAETRIDDGIIPYVPDIDHPDPRLSHVASRSKGLWLSDATHQLSLPYNTMMSNGDDFEVMRGLWEVWKHRVDVRGSAAWVNLLLNGAHQYMDVYSSIPYSGRVHVRMRADIGPIGALAVRVPSWTDSSKITLLEDVGQGARVLTQGPEWSFNGDYVVFHSVKPNGHYELQFPMKVRWMDFISMNTMNDWWYEASHGSGTNPEKHSSHWSVFLGDTLVDAAGRPTCSQDWNDPYGCIPRYQRQNLAPLTTGAGTEVNPPTRTVTRFALGATSGVGPGPTGVDVGLRAFDGAQQIKVAAEPLGTLTSPLRFRGKDNNVYGVILVDPSDASASKLRLATPQGPKALRRLQ